MSFTDETIDFASLKREEIQTALRRYSLPLTVEEILKVQNEILGRPPSLVECVLWSIQGSEHSSYKSSRSHLTQLVSEGPTVILPPKEDAGIVAVAEDAQGYRYGAVLSHESHNHPSQIVPYEGAATGIGGNVRDVACMGATVIAVADALRFGQIDSPKTRWIHDGVVSGIAGYGNPIGVPNIGGDIYYDEGYNDNCLVTVVTLGIVREDEIIRSRVPDDGDGYDLILVGKPTDNSGFGGASFASLELNENEKQAKKGAVQEPNAFLERHLLKATYALFTILKERGLLSRVALKDLGAGGIACASVELADGGGYGAEVFLDHVPVGMTALHPSVILCSETQERFMWAAPPDITPMILRHYNVTYDLPTVSRGAEASVVGKVTRDGRYRVYSNGTLFVDAPARQVTKGFSYQRPFSPRKKRAREPDIPEPADYDETLLAVLSHENVASRSPVFETYDKQVQGRTVIEAGQADAGVLQPFADDSFPEEIRQVGLALSIDHNPRYCKIDPYWGAVNAVVESMRNVAAVGATPQAVTDCLCFGNPEKEHQMWDFTESVRGVADACKQIHLKEFPEYPVPVIAGNVSFYNESNRGPIPPSPIVGCLGKVADVSRIVTAGFKKPDSLLLLVGERKDECGGSVYYSLYETLGNQLPKPDLREVEEQIYAVTDAASAGLLLSCHDISEGGIAAALTEMSFLSPADHPGLIGCRVDIPGSIRTDRLLFSETGGFVLEVEEQDMTSISDIFDSSGVSFQTIGRTTSYPTLEINSSIRLALARAKDSWLEGLRKKLQ